MLLRHLTIKETQWQTNWFSVGKKLQIRANSLEWVRKCNSYIHLSMPSSADVHCRVGQIPVGTATKVTTIALH